MSMPTATYAAPRTTIASRMLCYLELSKPRIAALVLVTVAVAAFVGSGGRPEPLLLLHTLIGVALVAASASALNQFLERKSDALMQRTADRPLPSGRLCGPEVLILATCEAVAGIGYLGVAVNWLTAAIGLSTWFLYVAVYTPMKPRTPANTVVGAVAGALPVLMGWAAVNGPVSLSSGGLTAAVLFFVVYLWQFPHFMAIAWMYREDYSRAGLKMLTVVDPRGRRAGVQAVVAALALLPVSLLPAFDGSAGAWYAAAALVLGCTYLYFSMLFLMRRSQGAARQLLRVSLIHLPALLGLLIVSKALAL
jgi:protoheme IX farnesyltransferase